VDFLVPEQISVRHLLEHKSAIPSMFSHINDCTDESTLDEIKELAGRVPLGVPGETIKCSNTNYLILGLLIESVTGQDPGEHMSEHLFTPLQMGDT
jgi:D-alanyl-D-alanine carboxypeptidase